MDKPPPPDAPFDTSEAQPEKEPQTETEHAVALSHDKDSDTAPTIVAKGKGELAKKILELAFQNNVKVRSDRDLVMLLEKFETETQIPTEAFATVAEILNYVYKINNDPDVGSFVRQHYQHDQELPQKTEETGETKEAEEPPS